MRALVVGAGVAGASVARHLQQVGVTVELFDQHASGSRFDRGLGIWPAGQKSLQQLGIQRKMNEVSHARPPAAYRTSDGKWISGCSETKENMTLVRSIRESELLKLLQTEVSHLPALEASYGKVLTEIKQQPLISSTPHSSNGVELTFSDGTIAVGDFVVAADGAFSTLRHLTAPPSEDSPDGLQSNPDVIIYSGISEGVSGVTIPRPFETLQSGHRFACVPLKAGQFFWFCHLRKSDPAVGEMYHDSSTSNEDLLVAHFTELQYHHPIPAIVQAACASSSNPGSKIREEALLERPRCFHRSRCVFVGDARETTGANLAQGAAIALEDASSLAQACEVHLKQKLDPSADTGEALTDTFMAYEQLRLKRVEQHALMTRFTAAICSEPGSLPIPIAATSLLPTMIGMVPNPVNRLVFDISLRYSLGSV
jgi:FAD-dependent urate hydroxylase